MNIAPRDVRIRTPLTKPEFLLLRAAAAKLKVPMGRLILQCAMQGGLKEIVTEKTTG